jgi:hypothetical protein
MGSIYCLKGTNPKYYQSMLPSTQGNFDIEFRAGEEFPTPNIVDVIVFSRHLPLLYYFN